MPVSATDRNDPSDTYDDVLDEVVERADELLCKLAELRDLLTELREEGTGQCP